VSGKGKQRAESEGEKERGGDGATKRRGEEEKRSRK